MNIYIDESGSINNHNPNNKYFIIALIHAVNKASLKRAYKRFVSSNYNCLLELDKEKIIQKTASLSKQAEKCLQMEVFKNLKALNLTKI